MVCRFRFYCALLAIGVLASCSTGGDRGTPTSPGNTPTVAQVEFDSFALVNVARSDNGVQPQLVYDEALAAVARSHSEQMRDLDFFGHSDDQGRTVGGRLTDAGIGFSSAGENLARTTNIANPAVWAHDQLMASDEHRPNILNEDYLRIGVGVARAGTTYWITQVFVAP